MMLIEQYLDKEEKKITIINELLDNKLTEKDVYAYIIKYNLNESDIQQIENVLDSQTGALNEGLAALGKAALQGGAKLAKGAGKLAGKAAKGAVQNSSVGQKIGKKVNQLAQKGAKTAVGKMINKPENQKNQPTQQISRQKNNPAQNTAITQAMNLLKLIQNNPKALKYLKQKILPQMQKLSGKA